MSVYDEVRQIMPADGWMGVYKENEGGGYFFSRIAGWALIEDLRGNFRVVGLDVSATEGVSWENPGCLGYVHEKDNTPSIRRDIEFYLRKEAYE